MVSLKMIVFNMLRVRHSPKCSVEIGKYTDSIPYIVSAEPTDRVVIGKYCSIGHGVILITHQGHMPAPEYREYRVANYPMSRVGNHGWRASYHLPDRRNFVYIGNDVWIGANAIILPGVRIGDGAIVGAGAIVSHGVSPYAVVAGVPARFIRYRYGEDQIRKLLKIAWWDWDEKKIFENMDYFYGKVDVFISKFYDESEEKQCGK